MSNRAAMPPAGSDPHRSVQVTPHRNQPLLPRARLLRRIQAALRSAHVLLVAPAGYGKSTLLRALVAHQPESYYLALTPADVDLVMFQSRLQAIPPQAAVIVLDDVHHLVDAAEVVAWLGDRMRSPAPRWVLGGRLIPPHLAACGNALSPAFLLERKDLAFRGDESRALLHALGETRAAHWHDRTQGWPLALAIVANAPADTLDSEPAAADGEMLFADLAQSVFAALPANLREFARLSALPLRFSDALLAEILGRPLEEIASLRAEVQRRNLFLEATEQAGWFAYHEVVRHHLCRQVDCAERQAVASRLVSYFAAVGDLHMAVEHALDGELYDQAAQLMSTHGGKMLLDLGWRESYRRWLATIPDPIRSRWPLALAQWGFALVYQREQVDEGLGALERARTLANQLDELTAKEVELRLAMACFLSGQSDMALPLLLSALAYPNFPLHSQVRGRLYLATIYARLNRLRDASLVYRDTARLLEQMEEGEEKRLLLDVLRHNRGTGIEAVRGDFARFEATLQLSLEADAGKPAALEMDHVGFCILHENLGDWDALAEDLRQIKAARLEQLAGTRDAAGAYTMTAKWELFYWAAYQLGREALELAQPLIDLFAARVADAEAVACGQWLQAWHLRTGQRYAECVAFVDALPPAFDESARYYRAAIAFERAAAALLAGHADWYQGSEPSVRFHMRVGASHYLLRWRLCFALAGHRQGARPGTKPDDDTRTWRKHVRFVLRALRRKGYDRLLAQREPELAAHFWALCAAEAIHPAMALTEIKRLGRIAPVVERLESARRHASAPPTGRTPTAHGQPHACDAPDEPVLRLIRALAALGKEEAIPRLDGMLATEPRAAVRQAVKRALIQLEALPPPRLEVKLLGSFALRRGGVLIPTEAWQRPSVRQLFQYFCIHRGVRLTRAQILQDLWPESTPERGLAAFRTSFSRLGNVLEPYLRRRTAMRYFEVVGDRYVFDPQQTLVAVDSEEMTRSVQSARRQDPRLDETQLSALVEILGTWDSPLTEVAYAAWAVHTIEDLKERFAAGCLLVARGFLARERLAEATTWAEKGLAVAPWNEECWQTLILCAARQGQRSLALKRYEQAVHTLESELGAPPSPETVRLVERLRCNETV